jgi:hypothetical protein
VICGEISLEESKTVYLGADISPVHTPGGRLIEPYPQLIVEKFSVFPKD